MPVEIFSANGELCLNGLSQPRGQEQADSYGGDAEAGRKYLEKLIQVPLNLPAADPKALRDFCLEHVWRALGAAHVRLDDGVRSEFLTKFYVYIAPELCTPRDAKRYANTLAFTMPLLEGEVHPLDVLLLEAMKIFYPILFASIRRTPHAFTGAYDELHFRQESESFNVVRAAIDELDPARGARAQRLLFELFPQVKTLLGSKKFGSSSDWWPKGQRVASEDYLKRYLTLSVPEGDVSDKSIEELIRAVKTEPIETASARLQGFLDAAHWDNLLYKLSVRADQLDKDAAEKFALLFARNGDALPRPEQLLGYASPLHRTALLIREFLERIPNEAARLTISYQLIQEATPLPLAHTCFLALGPRENDFGSALLTKEAYSRLDGPFSERMAAEVATGESLVQVYPQDFALLLLQWSKTAGCATVQAYTKSLMANDPQVAVSLLISQFIFAPPSNSFNQRKYEDLRYVADPIDVSAATSQLDKAALTERERRTVNEFISVFEKSSSAAESERAENAGERDERP